MAAKMAKLIYGVITSLDLFIEDASGAFDWAAPDEEVHGFVNETQRDIGTHLLGRRMYEVLRYWDTAATDSAASPVEREYAETWRGTEKLVYSTTLPPVTSNRTRVERTFDPASVRRLKETSALDISIGGAALAAAAFKAGLVDECQVYLSPVIVAHGKPAFPGDMLLELELIDQRRFSGGVVFLRYRIGSPGAAQD